MTSGDDFCDSGAALDYLAAAHGLKYTPGYWDKLRHLGKGPRFYLVDNQIKYRPTDLDDHAKRRVVRGPFQKSSEARKCKRIDSAASIDSEVS